MTTILTTRTAHWDICRHRRFERNDRQIKTAGGTELQGQLQPCTAFADSRFGSRGRLAKLVAVLFVLVHLVVRDSLAGHAVYLRFVSKAQR
jgi:hypothetical protein